MEKIADIVENKLTRYVLGIESGGGITFKIAMPFFPPPRAQGPA